MRPSRRQFLGGVSVAAVVALAGCTSMSAHREAVSEYNDTISSPIFAYLSGVGTFDTPPKLYADIYANNLPALVTLRRPDGEEVDSIRVTDEDPSHLERSNARMGQLSFDGEGEYEIEGRSDDGISDKIQFTVHFEREWGIGRYVAILSET